MSIIQCVAVDWVMSVVVYLVCKNPSEINDVKLNHNCCYFTALSGINEPLHLTVTNL